jgi:phenylpyruvate tautomerase PptA (4-oxalocrotonate tautomerase family)
MIAFLTEAVRKHAGIPSGERISVFVLIRDVPASNWGMFGKQVSLDALRNPPSNALPV